MISFCSSIVIEGLKEFSFFKEKIKKNQLKNKLLTDLKKNFLTTPLNCV